MELFNGVNIALVLIVLLFVLAWSKLVQYFSKDDSELVVYDEKFVREMRAETELWKSRYYDLYQEHQRLLDQISKRT